MEINSVRHSQKLIKDYCHLEKIEIDSCKHKYKEYQQTKVKICMDHVRAYLQVHVRMGGVGDKDKGLERIIEADGKK